MLLHGLTSSQTPQFAEVPDAMTFPTTYRVVIELTPHVLREGQELWEWSTDQSDFRRCPLLSLPDSHPLSAFSFSRKRNCAHFALGWATWVRLTCKGGTSCSPQLVKGQGWGLITVWSQGLFPSLLWSSHSHLPVSDDRQLIQLETTLNQKKDRCFQFDNFLGTFDYVPATEVLKMQSWAARPTGCSETMRELKFSGGQKAYLSGILWINWIQLCGWSQLFL